MESINYQHLRYFWAVARAGSLTRASEQLSLTPQTVSTQIRDLEKALGEKLFLRTGRRLVLTDGGQLVYRYADEIFSLGQELMETLQGRPSGRPLRLVVGVADVLPKLIAHRLIEPALQLEEPVQVVCREDRPEKLIAELAVHGLDVVLSDAPIPPGVKVRAYNHLLGECGVTFMASARLADTYRKKFPRSLEGAPFLLPTENTVLRRALGQWFTEQGIHPMIAGEFEDSALLKVFGQAGVGIFAVPSAIEDEVERQYAVRQVGKADGVVERFYAISVERKIRHPAIAAICNIARTELFA